MREDEGSHALSTCAPGRTPPACGRTTPTTLTATAAPRKSAAPDGARAPVGLMRRHRGGRAVVRTAHRIPPDRTAPGRNPVVAARGGD
ncbi:hypothetical protein ACFXO2_35650 [Streptomyces sp. NPDC059152]|uniref:hypothetical protein n=1 Tax=Streptomyces sp. NPDC059152 TaxID=3346742 RepID=UPI00367EA428